MFEVGECILSLFGIGKFSCNKWSSSKALFLLFLILGPPCLDLPIKDKTNHKDLQILFSFRKDFFALIHIEDILHYGQEEEIQHFIEKLR